MNRPYPFTFSNKWDRQGDLICIAAAAPDINVQANSDQEFERLLLDELMDIVRKLPAGANKERLNSLIAIIELYFRSK